MAAAYEAAANPEVWPHALEATQRYVQSSSAMLYLVANRENDARFFQWTGKPGSRMLALRNKFYTYYLHKDPAVVAKMRMPVGTVTASNLLLPDRELMETEYYRDFQRHTGFFYQLGAYLQRDPGQLAVFSAQRQRSAGGFTPHDVRKFEILVLHVRRAFELPRRLAERQEYGLAFGELVQRLPLSVFLIAESGRVVFLNKRAEALIA